VEEMIGPAVAEAPSRTLKVNFSASNAATRTSFAGFNEEAGVYPVIWSGQEAVVMSLNYDDPADATLTKVTDSHATFSGAFNDTGGSLCVLCPEPVFRSDRHQPFTKRMGGQHPRGTGPP
jgi:hypothetical protein